MAEQPLQRERVSAKAEQAETVPKTEPERQYCIFRAGRERFCFSVLDLEEVVEWPRLTRVPLTPSFLMGIFILRGSVVAVIDIALREVRRQDLPPRHVVVASLPADGDRADLRIGIAADEVIGAFSTADPVLAEETPRDAPYCGGMLRHEERLAMVLDLRKLAEAFPVGVVSLHG